MNTHQARIILSILLLTTICLHLTSPVKAQEAGFEENFDDPALPDWEVIGEPTVRDGYLFLTDGAGIQQSNSWATIEVLVHMKINGPGEFMINTRLTESGGLSLIAANEYLVLEQDGNIIMESPIEPIPEGTWFSVSFFIDPGMMIAEVDGEQIFEAQLDSNQAPGSFNISYHGSGNVEVDSVMGGGVLAQDMDPDPVSSPIPDNDALDADRPPAYQAGSWVHLGGPIGGLGYDIRYNYADHNIWYATDAWAGIHRSKDGGQTWEPINEGITATKGVDGIPVFCVTVDHLNPQTVWIGTEGTGQIYRSSDGGDTWVEMTNGIDQNLRPLTFRGLTVHPTDSNTLYAMGEIASYGWTPDGEGRVGIEMDLTRGIVYKTTDGGKHWKEIWRGDNLARYAWIHPDNPDIVYVSTGIFDRESANTDVQAGIAASVGILKTTDGGQTWQVINQENGLLDLYVGSLYMHPDDPDTLLAAAAQNNWSFMAGEYTGGIFITHDGGETWERVLDRPEYYSSVEFCEADPTIAYAGSLEAVYRSEDGGHTWKRFGRSDNTWGPPGIIAGVPIDMQCDPDNPDRIFVNNYGGGNFLSEDGGRTWVNASEGYSGAIMHNIAVVPGQPGWLYAGARSGLFRSTDGGTTWQGTAYPDDSMGAIAEIITLEVNPSDPLWVITSSDGVGLIVSKTGGNSWQRVKGQPFQAWTMTLSPSNPSTLYAGNSREACIDETLSAAFQEICDNEEGFFFRSDDSGLSWRAVNTQPLPGGGFFTLAVHPQDPETIYGGTLQGGIAKSTDGGATWVDLSEGLPITNRPSMSIAIDPFQPETIYISLEEAGIHKSIDGGKSWSQLAAGLGPEATIKDIVIDPTNSAVIYLASGWSGVHFTTNGGESWQNLNEGLTHRTANALGISSDGTVLYVGIEGAGVYRLGTPPPVEGANLLADVKPAEEETITDTEPGVEDKEPVTAQDQMDIQDREEKPFNICASSFPLLILTAGLIWTRRKKWR